jgi:hypothetical protein
MKGKKKEDLDLNTLPEVPTILVSLNQLAKDSNSKRTREAILKTKRTDFVLVNREDIKTFAKDKGLFVPPDDKKKPAPGTENLPKEATPAVMAEAFVMWAEDQILSRRLEKKEIADAIAAGKPPPTKKKEEKKKPDPKGKKVEEEVEEVEEQYPKDYELALIVENYPENREEMIALGKTKGGIDFLVNLELHIHHKKQEKPTEGEGVIPEADEKAEQDETLVPEIPEAKMTPEEFDQVEHRRTLKMSLEEAKLSSIPKSKLRSSLSTDVDHEVIVEELDKTWEKVKDSFFKHLGEVSLVKKEYSEWLKSVTVRPLLTPKAPPKVTEEPPKEEPAKKDDKKKPDPKKDDKKGAAAAKKEEESHLTVEPPKPEPPKEPAYIEAQELVKSMEDKLNVKLEYFRAVNLLDVFASIIDKQRSDFESSKAAQMGGAPGELSVKTDVGEIDNFLDDIFQQVSEGNIGAQIKIPKTKEEIAKEEAERALKSFENKGSYSIHDHIGLHKRGHGTFGRSPLEELENETFIHLNTPGINRYSMPQRPKMSEQTRRYNLGQINAFHNLSEPELKRRLVLKDFMDTLTAQYPNKEWDFFDRGIIENFDQDTFAQRYLEAKLSDPQEVRKYNPLTDSMEIALVDHTQKTFMDLQVWESPWSILPDFEDWIRNFKNNTINFNNKHYFGLDAQEYGSIRVERNVFDLRNGGIVRVTDRQFKRSSHKEVRLNFAELVAGIEPSLPRDEFVRLIHKETIERELTPEEMEQYNPILKDKKKKRTKEEEEALIRTVKEEKIHEDRVYVPPRHSLLWVTFKNLTRVIVELERVVDPQKLQELGIHLSTPIHEIFGAQAGSYSFSAVTTVSLPNGVVVKILPDGDILMKSFEKGNTKEDYRMITGNGTNVLFFADGRREVLLASGNLMKFEKGVWITTNSKGLRKKIDLNTGIEEELSPIPAVNKFSGVHAKFPIECSREDGSKFVLYENRDKVTSFKDGTQILTSHRKQMCIVEPPNLPVIKIFHGKTQDDTYRKISPVVDKIVSSVEGGQYKEIFFPDQSIGYVYLDKETGEAKLILETAEGGLMQCGQDGKSILIPAECRWNLKTLADNKAKLEKKRHTLISKVDEIERNVSSMQEAIVNMSKAQPKGKKLTKKQLREEKEKEEQKIREYIEQSKTELTQMLESLERETKSDHVGGFSSHLDQLELGAQERVSGVISFDIMESNHTFTK